MKQTNPIFNLKSITSGLSVTNAKDISRTNLYDLGKTVIFSTKLSLAGGPISSSFSIDIAPLGWSDWSFSRLVHITNVKKTFGKYGFRARSLFGKF